jgi:uncharacterized oxidoreductase
MKLGQKNVLITGGTDGIGRELAQQLKAEGAHVIIAGRNAARLSEMAEAGFSVIAADLATADGRETLIKAVAGNPLDILVNNAGIDVNYDVTTEIDTVGCEEAIQINMTAPVYLIAKLLPTLRARPEAMIVNVTSGFAIAPTSVGPLYCGTKAGMRSFTLALRHQLRKTRVHVLEVLPPVVETKMTDHRQGKRMPVATCARHIVRAMRNNRKEANIGAVKMLRVIHDISPIVAGLYMREF